MKLQYWIMLLSALLAGVATLAQEPKLQPQDMVAICGDSITEQRQYSVFMEDYLLMCRPVESLRAMQFGWGGSCSWDFLREKLQNNVLRFQPTVTTTCFGMNDGGYGPLNPDTAKNYRAAQLGIVQAMKKAGVRLIVVGSPGCFDEQTSHGSNKAKADIYNTTLAALGDIGREVALQEGVIFADLHTPMLEVMRKAEAKYGEKYFLAADSVHPWANGHLVMAYAFLKALGCDGDIGTITLDLAAGKAEATAGHNILDFTDGTAEIESTRYPFCFFGDPASANSTRGVLEFFPFNDELNRLRLVVKNVDGERVNVTWGNVTKEYAATELEKGINLAAEFLDNPFCDNFFKVDKLVRAQQNFELPFIKNLVHTVPLLQTLIPEEAESIDRIVQSGTKRDKALFDAAVAAQIPVKHKIIISVVK